VVLGVLGVGLRRRSHNVYVSRRRRGSVSKVGRVDVRWKLYTHGYRHYLPALGVSRRT